MGEGTVFGAFGKTPNVLANLPVAHQTPKMQVDLKLFLPYGVMTRKCQNCSGSREPKRDKELVASV